MVRGPTTHRHAVDYRFGSSEQRSGQQKAKGQSLGESGGRQLGVEKTKGLIYQPIENVGGGLMQRLVSAEAFDGSHCVPHVSNALPCILPNAEAEAERLRVHKREDIKSDVGCCEQDSYASLDRDLQESRIPVAALTMGMRNHASTQVPD